MLPIKNHRKTEQYPYLKTTGENSLRQEFLNHLWEKSNQNLFNNWIWNYIRQFSVSKELDVLAVPSN